MKSDMLPPPRLCLPQRPRQSDCRMCQNYSGLKVGQLLQAAPANHRAGFSASLSEAIQACPRKQANSGKPTVATHKNCQSLPCRNPGFLPTMPIPLLSLFLTAAPAPLSASTLLRLPLVSTSAPARQHLYALFLLRPLQSVRPCINHGNAAAIYKDCRLCLHGLNLLHNSTRLKTFLLCLRRNCCNRCSKSAFSVLRQFFSMPSAAQSWQLRCLLPLLCRSILHLLPFYGMKKALFPVLSCCFFNLTSLYNISFFRAKKGNKTAFRAIGGNFGQYLEIFLFYLVAIQNRLCYNFIRQQKDNRVCHVAHKKNEPPESSGVLPGVLPLFGEVNRLG